ncbi:MAG: transketolase, partial [Thermodesulfobacteriota bacterium]
MSLSRDLEKLIINCIRTLSMDAVEKANSGHPGTPMALAPCAFTLWDKFIRHNPKNPDWPGRDRFVLSAGHASMLIYSILHINGYGVSLDDIKSFRQLHSICAGHPEYGLTPGIETTTGPLGQGVATSVGMAAAEKWLAGYFNRDGFNIIDYNIYSICSDGDLMEGISSEAASIAGHLGLGNLIWIYDDNGITIEGKTNLAFSEDVGARFKSLNWSIEYVSDANDLDAINNAVQSAKNETEKPSIIVLKSHIAYGSPNMQDDHNAHGSPLGYEEIKLTKKFYGSDPDAEFQVPVEIENYRKAVLLKGESLETSWKEMFELYSYKFPLLSKEFELLQSGTLPSGWENDIPFFPA